VVADIRRQDSAQRRQSSAQRSIVSSPSAIRSHSSAQRSQISAQIAHVCEWKTEARSMKSALVAQICAQSSSRAMCPGAAWGPPIVRQWMAVSVQIAWQSLQFPMQLRMSSLM